MKNVGKLKKYGIDINAVLDWLNGNGEVTEIDGESFISDEDHAAIIAAMLADKKDKYGSVEYEGKPYTLTDQAYVDNHLDGTAYFAIAVNGETDSDGTLLRYSVRWDETEEWVTQSEIYKKLYAKKCDAEHGGEPLTEEEIDSMNDAETYVQDEERACDWDDPADVHLI